MSAKSGAQRQADFRKAMARSGMVRVQFYATAAQREKLRALGGPDWLLRKIESARVKITTRR